MENKKFSCKHKKDYELLSRVEPTLLKVFADIVSYCYQKRIPVQITQAIAEPIQGVSKSTTHREGRAIDISVRGWDVDEIDDVVKEFNDKYGAVYGTAPTAQDKPRVMVYHHGTAWHIHVQIRRNV
jgi:uncharacterized protein YcbK (DUF882 family)